jgi:hypothetical protein
MKITRAAMDISESMAKVSGLETEARATLLESREAALAVREAADMVKEVAMIVGALVLAFIITWVTEGER